MDWGPCAQVVEQAQGPEFKPSTAKKKRKKSALLHKNS
jgi:hypothetical protein